jgi:hypothetical protein
VTALAGQFVVEASTAPEHALEFLAETRRLLAAQAEAIDAVDLERARNQLAVRRLRDREHAARRLEDAALDVLAFDRVRSAAEISAASSTGKSPHSSVYSTGSVIDGFAPHTGHWGSLGNRISLNRGPNASISSSRPISGSPSPAINLMASVAMIAPMDAHSMPSTPPSAHDGAISGGGGSG